MTFKMIENVYQTKMIQRAPGIVKARAVTEVSGKVLTPFRNVKLWSTETGKRNLTKGNTMVEEGN